MFLQVEERRLVGDAGGLLHVVGHDDDGVGLLEVLDQVLDGERRDRVERRAGLVHQQHVRCDRDRAGDAQALLLSARQAGAGTLKAVLDLVPQVRAAQRLLDDLVGLAAGEALVVEADPRQHVLLDAHGGERVGPLEHHADLAAHPDRVDGGVVQVDAVEQHASLAVGAGDDLVHAVQRPQHGRLAAARRADERRHRAGLDHHVDVLDGVELAVEDVEILDLDALGHVWWCSFCLGQRPALGANFQAIRRPTRFSPMTMMISVSAPVQARSM